MIRRAAAGPAGGVRRRLLTLYRALYGEHLVADGIMGRDEVQRMAQENPSLEGMGSTITVGWILGDRLADKIRVLCGVLRSA